MLVSAAIALTACGSDGKPVNANAGGNVGQQGGATGATLGGSSGYGGANSLPSGGTGNSNAGGSTGTSSTATTPTGTRLGAYGSGTCALNDSGKMTCWGVIPPSTHTIVPPSASTYVTMSAGWTGACGITTAGKIECFHDPNSNGSAGSCGLIATGAIDCTNDVDFNTRGGTLTATWSRVIGGGGSICAIQSDGSASCLLTMAQPAAGVAFSDLSIGEYHGCGIRQDSKELLCWTEDLSPTAGCTDATKLGQGNPPTGQYSHVASGWYHSCAIGTDGTVTCWGAGNPNDTSLNDNCSMRYNFGQGKPPAGAFKSIAAGMVTTCGIKTDGTIACWGAGTTNADCASSYECGQAMPPSGTFSEVAVGESHACAMTAAGKVQCWGSNTGGRSTPPAEFQ